MGNVLYYTVSDDLTHHGILGMKWGQRNGPPYPLGASDHSSAEKKAGTKGWSKEAKQENKKKSAASENSAPESATATTKKKNEPAAPKDKKGLSTKQKVLIGATALVAAYAAYAFVDSGGTARLIQKGKMFVETGKTDGIPWKRNDKLARSGMDADTIFKNVVEPVNPRYPQKGASVNCLRCSYAYELRRRGFDVEATLTDGSIASGQTIIQQFKATHIGKNDIWTGYAARQNKTAGFEDIELPIVLRNGKEIITAQSAKDKSNAIFNRLAKCPNGSRGELSIFRVGAGGHSVAWEIIDNKPVLFDCQVSKVYKTADEYSIESALINEAYITRLDNVELNTDFLLRWVKSKTKE